MHVLRQPMMSVAVAASVSVVALAGSRNVFCTGPGGPVIVIETSRAAIELEMYPADAPKTVEHFVALVKKGLQLCLPRSPRGLPGSSSTQRDPADPRHDETMPCGDGSASGSGHPIGVAEFLRKCAATRKGPLAMAHWAIPKTADSQDLHHARAAAPARRQARRLRAGDYGAAR